MTNIVMDEYILPAVVRYRDRYRWSWPMTTRIINLYYGADYTAKALELLYQRAQKGNRYGM